MYTTITPSSQTVSPAKRASRAFFLCNDLSKNLWQDEIPDDSPYTRESACYDRCTVPTRQMSTTHHPAQYAFRLNLGPLVRHQPDSGKVYRVSMSTQKHCPPCQNSRKDSVHLENNPLDLCYQSGCRCSWLCWDPHVRCPTDTLCHRCLWPPSPILLRWADEPFRLAFHSAIYSRRKHHARSR